MTDKCNFSDEQLTAYLDGEKEHTPYAEIDAASKNNPQVQSRLEQLEINRETIKQSMASLLALAPEAPELPKTTKVIAANTNHRTSWLRNSLIAASTAAVMLFSGILGYSLADKETDSWREYVAAYHYLYINNTLSHINRDPQVATNELERVGAAIGKKLELASLGNLPSLDYKRAQILGFQGKPLVQMTFLSKMGTPIALCVIRSGTTREAEITDTKLEGMASASWSKGGYEYLLIGGKDKALIDQAAKHFAATI